MFVHKDIIIVFLFLFIISLIIIILFLRDQKKITKDLQNFTGKPIKSSKYFFYNLMEPIIFNINSIISKQQSKFKSERLRVYFYDYFFNKFPDPLLIIDETSNIIEINEVSTSLLGKNSKGKNILSVLRIPELGDLINDSVQKKKPIESEVRLIYPKEKVFKIWISGRRHVGESQLNFIRLYDSTSENNIQNLQRDFIANVSHELKTPITSILGYCETFISEKLENKNIKKKFFQTMMNEAQRMSTLVNDLLSLTRIERIEHSPPSQSINLAEILREVSKICSERAFINESKYSFILPKKKIMIIGDKSELKQVFLNIIENAIIHSNSKKPIQIKLSHSKAGIIFSVEDFGIGISNQHVPLLTKRFFRVDPSRSRESGNTGLGLSIVKHTLNRHNAELNIQSTVNKGSKFSIIFNKTTSSLLQ